MKYQFFAQGESSIRAELRKEEKKYLLAVDSGASAAELDSIKQRILMLDIQLKRAASGYS